MHDKMSIKNIFSESTYFSRLNVRALYLQYEIEVCLNVSFVSLIKNFSNLLELAFVGTAIRALISHWLYRDWACNMWALVCGVITGCYYGHIFFYLKIVMEEGVLEVSSF